MMYEQWTGKVGDSVWMHYRSRGPSLATVRDICDSFVLLEFGPFGPSSSWQRCENVTAVGGAKPRHLAASRDELDLVAFCPVI